MLLQESIVMESILGVEGSVDYFRAMRWELLGDECRME